MAKRTRRTRQHDLFEGPYTYWIVATNIPYKEKDTQAMIHFQNGRGEFEKMIGELKHHHALDHMPRGLLCVLRSKLNVSICVEKKGRSTKKPTRESSSSPRSFGP